MIDLSVAGQLLDFGSRLGAGAEERAAEQLRGAVALHNLLASRRVAYLADEVGMGKTYVALGAVALFRHFDPGFRVLVIAPRRNIQSKWRKELRNFVEHNVKFPDLRVKGLDGRPARASVMCERLTDFLRESRIDPDRDFFTRLTSFSLGLPAGDESGSDLARKLRGELEGELPHISRDVLSLRNRDEFKQNVARAICSGLPDFDLVIVDEGHNLKHGIGQGRAARNNVLGLAFGRCDRPDTRRLFKGYGPRAKRVLFLSATPIEDTYRHLYQQLDVFGLTGGFERLVAADASDDERKTLAAEILIRRVTVMHVGGAELTKNMYRRDWRAGGVERHDQPIEIRSDRQRLAVALVQKKVSEIIGDAKFSRSFQIGMLASFESFQHTAGARKDLAVFDDGEQADDDLEREGVDVQALNHIGRSHRRRFGQELPHPKMDAVVSRLANAWRTGEKALVFVRRVGSVNELKRKLDDLYDAWLFGELAKLPEPIWRTIERQRTAYHSAKREQRDSNADVVMLDGLRAQDGKKEDAGGRDTFFAWFFRGEGPKDVISGANVQRRFAPGATLGTFFEVHHLAQLLQCSPEESWKQLVTRLGGDEDALRDELHRRGAHHLSDARRVTVSARWQAAQAAALEILAERGLDCSAEAQWLLDEFYAQRRPHPSPQRALDLVDSLARGTFFTALRSRPDLAARIWPESTANGARERLREQLLRAQLLASVARLGHAFLDFYRVFVGRLGRIERGTREAEDDSGVANDSLIHAYLDELDRQRLTPREQRGWAAFDELADASEHFDLIVDVNEPGLRNDKLASAATSIGRLLRQQQPVGGMFGRGNETLVRQFRMPGYPLVLISTEVLQEGEDLHTFCSSIHHYGISWTPSSMEQRIGRVDRVRSATDRRLARLGAPPSGDELLQVYYPYLADTVELPQVARVLERMNQFLELMHEGLKAAPAESQRLSMDDAVRRGVIVPPAIRKKLETAFPIREALLRGKKRKLAVRPDSHTRALARLERLAAGSLPGLDVKWRSGDAPGHVRGEVWWGERSQAFDLHLFTTGERLTLRCESMVGDWRKRGGLETVAEALRRTPAGVRTGRGMDSEHMLLSVEDRVLLTASQHDRARAAWLVNRVTRLADELERHEWGDTEQDAETLRQRRSEDEHEV